MQAIVSDGAVQPASTSASSGVSPSSDAYLSRPLVDMFTCKRKEKCKVISEPNYRLTESQVSWLQKTVVELEEKGFVSKLLPSQDEGWNSPVQLVPKKDSFRFTVNFKPTVNDQIENDDYPLPLPIALCQYMSKFRFFAKIDLSNGFWRVRTGDAATRQLFGFTVPGLGRYAWDVLPQGLKISPSTFQRFTDSVTEPLREFVRVYIDDFVIGGHSYEDCLANVNRLVETLTQAKCKINTDKSILTPVESITALGFLLSHDKVVPTNAYLDKCKAFSSPRSATELRQFLGCLAHIVRFYPALRDPRAALQRYLNSFKNRSFKWSAGINSVFESAKVVLDSPIAMHTLSPDLSIPVTIVTDAGDTGFAGMMLQNDKPVGFISRTYQQKGLQQGSSMLRELFALKETLLYFQADIMSRRIDWVTDNHSSIDAFKKREAANSFLARIFSHLSVFSTQLRPSWVRRDDPRIALVDVLGRV
jgi:hypothetical protein